MSATRVRRHIEAPRAAVYRVIVDAGAIATWMVPDGMTSHVHAFDAREGGTFRISLTYDAPTGTGKTTAQTDTFHGRFVKLVENEEVVEVVEFETADRALQGEMKITMTLADAGRGTELAAVHEGLPPGLSAADNEAGWTMSLAKLAALVEGDQAASPDRVRGPLPRSAPPEPAAPAPGRTLAEERWSAAWRGIGAPPPAGLLGDLVARYSEPHRFYHTLRHLEECFTALASAADRAVHLAEVELALWFHDAVYDTRARDNEERSARWAEEALSSAGAWEVVAGRVAQLVLATRHNEVIEGDDARLLVDVDLSILGAPEARFAEYERQVRREYGWVPQDAFREGRARVLRSFLERPSIYGTSWFASRLERRARANLERSLRELGG